MTAELETAVPADAQLVITRTFNAPRDLVFKAMTEQEALAKWWGPKGSTLDIEEFDLRPGGRFHYGLTGPDGSRMFGLFVYREIVSPEKIVFVSSFADAAGEIIPAFFSADWPLEVLNVWTLTEQGGQTTLTLRGGPINASEAELAFYRGMLPSMNDGFAGTFDGLDAYLDQVQATATTSEREIVITRTFDAPRDLVFAAFTDLKHLSQWWGPAGFTTTTHERDFRIGGAWRFTMHGPDGTDFPNEIVYTAIVKPERLAYDHGADDGNPPHFKVTVTFVEKGGKTELTMHSIFPTAEAMQATFKFGSIEKGKETLGRLAAHLRTL